MVVKMYSVYDVKTRLYQIPFPAFNDGDAIRRMSDEVNLKDCPVARHPEDYLLFVLGEYDDQNGKLSPFESPEQVIAFSELKKE